MKEAGPRHDHETGVTERVFRAVHPKRLAARVAEVAEDRMTPAAVVLGQNQLGVARVLALAETTHAAEDRVPDFGELVRSAISNLTAKLDFLAGGLDPHRHVEIERAALVAQRTGPMKFQPIRRLLGAGELLFHAEDVIAPHVRQGQEQSEVLSETRVGNEVEAADLVHERGDCSRARIEADEHGFVFKQKLVGHSVGIVLYRFRTPDVECKEILSGSHTPIARNHASERYGVSNPGRACRNTPSTPADAQSAMKRLR